MPQQQCNHLDIQLSTLEKAQHRLRKHLQQLDFMPNPPHNNAIVTQPGPGMPLDATESRGTPTRRSHAKCFPCHRHYAIAIPPGDALEFKATNATAAAQTCIRRLHHHHGAWLFPFSMSLPPPSFPLVHRRKWGVAAGTGMRAGSSPISPGTSKMKGKNLIRLNDHQRQNSSQEIQKRSETP
jgi:hypothetical protein